MEIVKDILEIIYYIAFIILICLIVFYAKKTYVLQASKVFDLFCKVDVQRPTSGSYNFRYILEIYNHGNEIAQNIEVFVADQKITTVDFIKPSESYQYPLGDIGQMMDINRVWPDIGGELLKGDQLSIRLVVSKKDYNYKVNTDILFAYRCNSDEALRDISQRIDDLSKNIKRSSSNSLVR